MSEIMIPDVSQPICLEQLRKALSNIVGLDEIANLIDANIIYIVLDVTASAQAAIFFLLIFQGEKSFSHEWNKRQCPHTRFGLSGIDCNQNTMNMKKMAT